MDAIIERDGLVESTDKLYEVPLSEIFSDSEFNCRGGDIAPMDVIDLSRSIQSIGLQQPIILQTWDGKPGKKYRIVSGHRRYKASQVADTKTIKAIVKTGLDELTARKFNLEENLKRQSLNILQEAKAVEYFYKHGWTNEMVVEELNVSKGWVLSREKLLTLDEDIQQEAAAGFLTQEHIKQLAGMKSRKQQEEAVRQIKTAKLNGEKGKISIVRKKPMNPFSTKVRNREEIFAMQETMQNAVGNNLATRALAWAAGEISDFEIHRDLKDFADAQGKRYEIPREMLERAGIL